MLLALLAAAPSWAQQPAFPGAEGFGMYTTGGRGGTVYHVTTLEDNSQKGSLRYALETLSGTKTIVFDVSGTIHLTKELDIKRGNVTIAGQTAPGDGICIADWPVVIKADNVIIRYLRFRLGNKNVASHEGDGLGGMDRKNLIIDHCSVSWSIDECLSVYGSNNITVQWCIADQSLVNSGHSKGAHGYGGNWGGSGASYHHNLLAHHSSRVPRLGPRQGTQKDERMDLRNNVFYNWAGEGCYGGEGMNVNIVNNYYKPGPATAKIKESRRYRIANIGIRTVDYCLDKTTIATNYKTATGTAVTSSNITGSAANGKNYVNISGKAFEIDMDANTIDVDGKKVTVAWNGWKPMLHKWGTFYVDGNVNPDYTSKITSQDQWTNGMYAQVYTDKVDGTFTDAVKKSMRLSEPIASLPVTTHTAEQAYANVLDFAGASLHRDSHDTYIVGDVRNKKATYTGSGCATGFVNSQDDAGGFPNLPEEYRDSNYDTDQDGMPDAWEDANGLNKNDASDAKTVCADGYTNLEHYLNSIVAHITEAQNANAITAIRNIETVEMTGTFPNNNVYTIDGRCVRKDAESLAGLAKGMYIHKGKTVVVD
ncbi:MAG: pectate lyase [Bacteroidales bacterium]|nr:pectate lyase [Bacteroidales bacterium]MCM1146579.1 pectate lyase [Bacteroidales bacterium]MCM1205971.1 pectate lyase [Bacillota bacterium]